MIELQLVPRMIDDDVEHRLNILYLSILGFYEGEREVELVREGKDFAFIK